MELVPVVDVYSTLLCLYNLIIRVTKNVLRIPVNLKRIPHEQCYPHAKIKRFPNFRAPWLHGEYVAVFERRHIISKFEPCHRILDLGCGDGTYTRHLETKATEVVGLDCNVERLAKVKNISAQVVLGDALHLPFKDQSFNIIWASEVIEHTPTLEIFSELERVAKGTITVTVPNSSGPYYRRDPTHILEYDVPKLEQFLARRDWTYTINGLGLCLPYKIIPDIIRKMFLKLTWRHPRYAFSILITGYPRQGMRISE